MEMDRTGVTGVLAERSGRGSNRQPALNPPHTRHNYLNEGP